MEPPKVNVMRLFDMAVAKLSAKIERFKIWISPEPGQYIVLVKEQYFGKTFYQ